MMLQKQTKFSCLIAIWVAISFTASSYAQEKELPGSMVERHKRFQSDVQTLITQKLSSVALARAIEREFEKYQFVDPSIASLNPFGVSDLRALFDALNTKSFYAESTHNAHALERAALALARRTELRPSDVKAVYGAFVAARLFDDATRFKDRTNFSPSESLPLTLNNTKASLTTTLWFADKTARILERRTIPELSGIQLVVVVSPQCQFSTLAMKTIGLNAKLAALLQPLTYWIVPPDRSLDFSKIQRWNVVHNLLPFTLVHKKEDWAFVDSWETPEFYFLKDGKVVDRLTGWPRDGSHEPMLLRKLHALQLSAPEK